MKYCIYTDGATSNNGYENAKGGWAAVLLKENNQSPSGFSSSASDIATGREMPTTNQRMELKAAIEGLKMLPDLSFGDEVILRTDSAYLYNCWKNKWYFSWENNNWRNSNKEPVANKDLWEELLPFFKNPKITLEKVKGHSNDYWNCFIDDLAVEQREKLI